MCQCKKSSLLILTPRPSLFCNSGFQLLCGLQGFPINATFIHFMFILFFFCLLLSAFVCIHQSGLDTIDFVEPVIFWGKTNFCKKGAYAAYVLHMLHIVRLHVSSFYFLFFPTKTSKKVVSTAILTYML